MYLLIHADGQIEQFFQLDVMLHAFRKKGTRILRWDSSILRYHEWSGERGWVLVNFHKPGGKHEA